jgi:hypothetical protein
MTATITDQQNRDRVTALDDAIHHLRHARTALRASRQNDAIAIRSASLHSVERRLELALIELSALD